jgi:predicted metal-dependent peptidase
MGNSSRKPNSYSSLLEDRDGEVYSPLRLLLEKENADIKKALNLPDVPFVFDKEQRERITLARVRMLMKHPFWGNLATRLKVVEASNWCPTAATDGRCLYYNQEFIKLLDDDELVFLVGHELLHCIYEHMDPDVKGDRNSIIWNIATDYNINMTLDEQGIGKVITLVEILLDYKYRGMSSFEIYDDVLANVPKIDLDKLVDKILDEHLNENGDGEDGEGEGKENGDDKRPGRPNFTKEERKQIKDELKDAVLQAAQAAGADNLPTDINRMINDLTRPKMDWKDLLHVQIESSLKSDYSFMRPNRKAWHIDAILPGIRDGEKLDVAIGIDASSSISDNMVREMLTEVDGIMNQYDAYNIHIWQFDTKVLGYEIFTHEDGKDIRNYKVNGGGGTEFMKNWEFMRAEGIEPKQLIIFTDGYPWGKWGEEHYCDTLFLIHGYPDKKFKAPFGVTAHYEEHARGA